MALVNVETTVQCDFCQTDVSYGNLSENEPYIWVAPGLIFYPYHHFGEYNGAEVCQSCTVAYQAHCIKKGIMNIDG